jgi:hypothetical protein
MISRSVLLTALPLLPHVSAWGTLGHDTVAFIAQHYISNTTASWAKSLLSDNTSAYLANVATWADTYRSTAEGSFSAPLHYIDALDSPPSACNVDYDRDCGEEGCVVSAIANYTARVTNTQLSTVERQKALKWIIHFIGDIHQPLHDENFQVGGNSISVKFNAKTTNLHSIWDTAMPEKLVGGYKLSDAQTWADEIVDAIDGGKYAAQAGSWLQNMDVKDSVDSAMVWARDANAYVCSTVLPQGETAVQGKELNGTYYSSSIPVIQLQIAKAGFRLAAWLDLIHTGQHAGVSAKREVGGRWRGGPKKFGTFGTFGTFETGREVERREVELEEWMVEAKRARRAVGWDCGHAH